MSVSRQQRWDTQMREAPSPWKLDGTWPSWYRFILLQWGQNQKDFSEGAEQLCGWRLISTQCSHCLKHHGVTGLEISRNRRKLLGSLPLLISARRIRMVADTQPGTQPGDSAWGQKATQRSHGPPQCHREVPAWEEIPELLRELGDLTWRPTRRG